MLQRTVIVTATAVGVLLVVFGRPMIFAQPPASQETPAAGCEIRINGWERPDLVPSHAGWEEAFGALVSEDPAFRRRLNLDSESLAMVSSLAKQALARLGQIRADQAVDPLARYAEAAEHVLDARDGLIRAMPEGTFDALNVAVTAGTSTHSYVLPIRGVSRDEHGLTKCSLTVKAFDYPRVVPETAIWENYFETMAPIASRKKLPTGEYPTDLIFGLRASHLKVSPFYVAKILDATIAAKNRLDDVRQTNGQPTSIAAAVLETRAELVRSLPISVWSDLKREVFRLAGGMIYSFPLTF